MPSRPPRPSRAGRPRRRRVRLGGALLYLVLIVIAIIYIFPFLIELATSFKTEPDAAADPLALIPPTWTTAAYHVPVRATPTSRSGSSNSAIVTVAVTIGRVFFDSARGLRARPAAVPRRGTRSSPALIAVMAVPGVVLLIPKFLVINQLGMYDSYSGMIVPLLADAAGVFIMKNFFESIPVARRGGGADRRGGHLPPLLVGRSCRWRGPRSSRS